MRYVIQWTAYLQKLTGNSLNRIKSSQPRSSEPSSASSSSQMRPPQCWPLCSLQICDLILRLLICAFATLVNSQRSRISSGLAVGNPFGPGAAAGSPCVYEGHLRTDRNWFGYLANVSVLSTGRMTFEFSYLADRGCQNILFYSDDQVSIINARMNCWQKEYLLRPEDDQILRLTPRFSWSGCHMSHPNGIATYVCEGGRSFTIESPPPPSGRPMTWYIAVSNCNSLDGLDIQYRLVVYSHVGDCPTSPGAAADDDDVTLSVSKPQSKAVAAGELERLPDGKICVLDGQLNTTLNWFGFIANVSLARGGGFRFRFTYPSAQRVINVVLYRDDDLARLNREQTCWQKEGVIRTRFIPDQILDLDSTSSWNGCVTRNASSAGGRSEIECVAGRRYDEGRSLALAVSNCRSTSGLLLRYHLEIHGYLNDICGASPRHGAASSRWLQLLVVVVIVAASSRTFATWC